MMNLEKGDAKTEARYSGWELHLTFGRGYTNKHVERIHVRGITSL